MRTYRVTYYAEAPGLPTRKVTVKATNTQAARDEAKRLDAQYLATVKTPVIIKDDLG
jgi:hypothetical protein